MSDSEEGAFASADEGESPTKVNEDKKKLQAVKKGSPQKGGDSVPKTKSNPTPKSTATDGNSRGKGKAQQKQLSSANAKKKERGRGSGQQAAANAKEEPGQAPAQGKEAQLTAANTPSTKQDQGEKTAKAKTESESPSGMSKSSSGEDIPQAGQQSAVTTEADRGEISRTDSPKVEERKTKQAGEVRRSISSGAESEDNTAAGALSDKKGDQQQQQVSASDKGQSGGWGWSNWGSSIISAASSSVQTFTDQVGDGISTIIDTVESSLGVPDAEELARANSSDVAQDSKEKDGTTEPGSKIQGSITDQPEAVPSVADTGDKEVKQVTEESTQSEGGGGGGGWFSSWGVASIAKKVTDTGKSIASKGQTFMTEGFDAVENLASGGIDVLENIGKKTYHTLSEHDPAFKKTRDYLQSKAGGVSGGSKASLSSLLKEAKEQAEVQASQQQEQEEACRAHFETLFDEYQGIAHLEALEILSNQSEKKVQSLLNSLSSGDLKDIKPRLIAIKEVFEVDHANEQEEDGTGGDQDFSRLVSQHLSELQLGTAPDKLHKVHAMVKQWMQDFDAQDSKDTQTPKAIHQQAIQSLAELTSKGVEQFHKAGELVLMQTDSDKDCTERAHSFARLTGVLCHEIGNLATKFSDCLNQTAPEEQEEEDKADVTRLVTNVYLEASNSSTYVQDAFQLLLPVLQQAAIEHAILSRSS